MSSDGLVVRDVHVRFDDLTAVDGASLTAAPGEIVALLGPSGCGKSTLLRVVAGLQAADRGVVRWRGRDLTAVAPQRRGIGLMFQDHALFPHRDVRANVAFGLRIRGVETAERQRRVTEMLELVGLEGFGSRAVDTLSGGEAQRVALARALAPRPQVLLLDEPLGSLDRTLRDRLASEVRGILKDLAMTAVHVTHDHDEAFTVADRLAVMRRGVVERLGPPVEVRRDPQSIATARFLGLENVLDGPSAAAPAATKGAPVVVLPEAISLVPRGAGLAAVIESVTFRGDRFQVRCRLADGTPLVTSTSAAVIEGADVGLEIDATGVVPLERPDLG